MSGFTFQELPVRLQPAQSDHLSIDPRRPGFDTLDPTKVHQLSADPFRQGLPGAGGGRRARRQRKAIVPGNRLTLNFFNRMVKNLPDEEAGR